MPTKRLARIAVVVIFLLAEIDGFAQRKTVAITIDDVPNVGLYAENNFTSKLLNTIDSLQLPVQIFINEHSIFLNNNYAQNLNLLINWIQNKNITAGNHGFTHQNFNDTSFQGFKEEILKGETITKSILKKSGKSETYFRFPYNSTGKNAALKNDIATFLKSKGYQSAPFTIHTYDFFYSPFYEAALANNNRQQADSIAQLYLARTLQRFEFFETLFKEVFHKNVPQILLIHDNKLNQDLLVSLLNELKNKEYSFISMQEALNDSMYKNEDYYIGSDGPSWAYRWMKDEKLRQKWMNGEPKIDDKLQSF